MLRSLSFVPLALLLLVSGCHWDPVAYQPQPGVVANPAGEIKALLNLREGPAFLIEVADDYIKEVFGSSDGVRTDILRPASARFRIITRDGIYQVSAYDSRGREIWAYRPATRDLATCQRMMNALYALLKRPGA